MLLTEKALLTVKIFLYFPLSPFFPLFSPLSTVAKFTKETD